MAVFTRVNALKFDLFKKTQMFEVISYIQWEK